MINRSSMQLRNNSLTKGSDYVEIKAYICRTFSEDLHLVLRPCFRNYTRKHPTYRKESALSALQGVCFSLGKRIDKHIPRSVKEEQSSKVRCPNLSPGWHPADQPLAAPSRPRATEGAFTRHYVIIMIIIIIMIVTNTYCAFYLQSTLLTLTMCLSSN